MPDGFLVILAEKPPEPLNAVSPYDMIRVEKAIDILHIGDVSPDDNCCTRSVFTDQFAHFFCFHCIWDNGADADDVIVVVPYFADEIFERGEIENGAGRFNVCLKHEQTEGSVKH